MVRTEPMRDMTIARYGTYMADTKVPTAKRLRIEKRRNALGRKPPTPDLLTADATGSRVRAYFVTGLIIIRQEQSRASGPAGRLKMMMSATFEPYM